MTEAKFRDIVETMIELNVIDPVLAMVDREYLTERFWAYVDAANTAREIMHMEPLM